MANYGNNHHDDKKKKQEQCNILLFTYTGSVPDYYFRLLTVVCQVTD